MFNLTELIQHLLKTIKMLKPPLSRLNLALIIGVCLLAAIPLLTLKEAEFAGADAQAEELITEINPDYEPWHNPVYEPASGEIESLLFSLQAGIGAGIIGYVIGWYRGKQQTTAKVPNQAPEDSQP